MASIQFTANETGFEEFVDMIGNDGFESSGFLCSSDLKQEQFEEDFSSVMEEDLTSHGSESVTSPTSTVSEGSLAESVDSPNSTYEFLQSPTQQTPISAASPNSNHPTTNGIQALLKPAKARDDQYETQFPKSLLCSPYKYDLKLVGSALGSSKSHKQTQHPDDSHLVLSLVDAETLELPLPNKSGIAVETVEHLTEGQVNIRFALNLCSFHYRKRPFRLVLSDKTAKTNPNLFVSVPFHTYARRRDNNSTKFGSPSKNSSRLSCLFNSNAQQASVAAAAASFVPFQPMYTYITPPVQYMPGNPFAMALTPLHHQPLNGGALYWQQNAQAQPAGIPNASMVKNELPITVNKPTKAAAAATEHKPVVKEEPKEELSEQVRKFVQSKSCTQSFAFPKTCESSVEKSALAYQVLTSLSVAEREAVLILLNSKN